MEVKTIKDLSRLFDLCRKKGIKEAKLSPDGGIAFTLGESPTRKSSSKAAKDSNLIATEPAFSEQDVLFWSSQGIPESALKGDDN